MSLFMTTHNTNSASGRRRALLAACLALGILGGAAADALITLRNGTPLVARAGLDALMSDGVDADLPPSASTTLAELSTEQQSAVGACSCVEADNSPAARSPFAVRRVAQGGRHRAAPVVIRLCSGAATVEP